MTLSNFKVGTRLGVGFVMLLLITVVVGVVGLMRLSQLDAMVVHITTEDWNKARLTMETETRNRDSAAKFARLLTIDADSEVARTLQAKICREQRGDQRRAQGTRAVAGYGGREGDFRRGQCGARNLQRVARDGHQARRGSENSRASRRTLQRHDGRSHGAVHRSAAQTHRDAAAAFRKGQRG